MSALWSPFQDWSPFLFILLAGALPTQMWRWMGAYFSRSLDEEGEVLRWVKAVATALVAGLIAKLVIFPSGGLVIVPLWARLAALGVGYGVYFATRPRIIWGIVAGELFLVFAALIYAS